jgi:pSer/pThr/pTyr-binding forkhead associated (FHA) protein
LWDFDSRNGTYVNGQRIRPGDRPAPAAREADLPGCALKDGDEIRVGDAVLRVQITAGEAEPGHVEAAAEASSLSVSRRVIGPGTPAPMDTHRHAGFGGPCLQ